MKYLIHIISVVFILSSCNTKKYIYLQEETEETKDSTFYPVNRDHYHIQPGDILYVSIHSTLSVTEGMFHFPGQENTAQSGLQEGNMYLNQSVVSEEGYIRMPVIGSIFVAGSSVEEIEEVIEKEARKYVSDALARVKLVSYEISFLGEFNNPGTILFYKDRVHILDALAAAGEITYFGDRRNLRVMRPTADGVYSYRIDLTDDDLLTSEKFYLQPNDVVYVEPLPRKIFRINVSDYSMILATITSTLAFVTLIVSFTQ